MRSLPVLTGTELSVRAIGRDVSRWLPRWLWAWSASAVLHLGAYAAIITTSSSQDTVVSAHLGRASLTLTASVAEAESSRAITLEVSQPDACDGPVSKPAMKKAPVKKAPVAKHLARQVVAEWAAPVAVESFKRRQEPLFPVLALVPPRQPMRLPKTPSLEWTASTASQESRGVESPTPAIISNPPPVYPATALAARQAGRVLLRVSITMEGLVAEARLYRSSGFPLLDQAALETVKKWRFNPTPQVDDVRVVNVPIDFVIRRR